MEIFRGDTKDCAEMFARSYLGKTLTALPIAHRGHSHTHLIGEVLAAPMLLRANVTQAPGELPCAATLWSNHAHPLNANALDLASDNHRTVWKVLHAIIREKQANGNHLASESSDVQIRLRLVQYKNI